MNRTCFYHAGCPDGFGAAWAVWNSWGDDAHYVAHGHDDSVDASRHEGDDVVFVDIAPPNEMLMSLADVCARVTVLDHHISSQTRYNSDGRMVDDVESQGHHIVFDLDHSGAVLAWNHFSGGQQAPDLLLYVEDQDLWNWKLPRSEEVNAAIASYPRRFDVWSALAERDAEELAREGEPIVRANRVEVERILSSAHPVVIGTGRIEAVNSTANRSSVGHELAVRARFGQPWGCVYRVVGSRVDASLYSVGELDVSVVAATFGGGGHRNAAGFSVPLERWLRDFI